jgi:hypothetical protein
MNRNAVLVLALAATLPAAAQDERPIRLTIAAGKVGEVCMPLAAGDTLAWHFNSSVAVDFNLHQHVGKDVLMPVDRKAIAEDRAEHQVDRKNDWCLMWTAPAGQQASVTGGWSMKKAK